MKGLGREGEGDEEGQRGPKGKAEGVVENVIYLLETVGCSPFYAR